jgi:hypothetical protein
MTNVLEEYAASFFRGDPEDEGRRLLQNVGTNLLNYVASHTRIPYS